MKISKYNCLYNIDNEVYGINLISGGIIKLEKSNLIDLLNNEIPIKNSNIEKDEVEFLKKGRFLIEDNINELSLLKFRYRNCNYNDNSEFLLTIIPTYNCNFNCSYCYQRQLEKIGYEYDTSIISTELLNSIEAYIVELTRNKRKFHIEWFGGEPLLAENIIIDFNYRIKEICNRNDCRYTSSIITNGYLLTEELAKRLKNSGIVGALITIDGSEKVHNKRRFLKDGRGSYDIILNNIINASKYLKINIRINIDEDNAEHIIELFYNLNETNINKKNVEVIIVPTATIGSCSNYLKNEYLNKKILEIFSVISKLGFSTQKNTITRNTNCAAKKNNFFVIDLNGKIYKCPTLAGHPNISDGIFDLKESQIKLNYNGILWNVWEPFDDENCIECKYLPICFGKCIYDDMFKQYNDYKIKNFPKIKEKTVCKKYTDEIIKFYIKKSLLNKEINNG